MSPAPHVCVERVRWADVDLVGIARYSSYTRFIEFAEQEWLRAAGFPFDGFFTEPSIWLPRRNLNIEYLAPARIDEPLALVTYVSRFGENSLTFHVEMLGLADGVHRVSAAVVLVCVNVTDFAKQPLPVPLRVALERYHCDRDHALAVADPIRRELATQAIYQ